MVNVHDCSDPALVTAKPGTVFGGFQFRTLSRYFKARPLHVAGEAGNAEAGDWRLRLGRGDSEPEEGVVQGEARGAASGRREHR